jgi:hypothetical protein
MYILSTFAAGVLVSPQSMKTQKLVPGDPLSLENDAPWVYSPFLAALGAAGAHPWVRKVVAEGLFLLTKLCQRSLTSLWHCLLRQPSVPPVQRH